MTTFDKDGRMTSRYIPADGSEFTVFLEGEGTARTVVCGPMWHHMLHILARRLNRDQEAYAPRMHFVAGSAKDWDHTTDLSDKPPPRFPYEARCDRMDGESDA
jgi:hypothetical protein